MEEKIVSKSKGVYNKEREYKYDNIKFILIFLVVFGHIIEHVDKFNYLYLIIYSFHMPVFVFVSGYFSKGSKKSILKSACIYVVFQTIYFFIYKLVLHENITLNYLQPIWILWYIFALAIWNSLIFVVKKININQNKYVYILLVFSFLLSLICGYVDKIGYFLSLSRIITFFPFFLIGYFSKNNNIKILKRNDESNKAKVLVYAVIAIVCIMYFINISSINKIWFYGSYSYRNAQYNIVFRFISSLFSLCMIFIFNNFISNKKELISVAGENTLFIYLLHGIIIKVFETKINSILETNNIIVSSIIAITLTSIIIARHWNNCVFHKKNNKKSYCKNGA